MTKKTKLIYYAAAVIVLAIPAWLFLGHSSSNDDEALPTVEVSRGTIIDKALAVGTIEPEIEISVKSKISGVVSRILTDVGEYVAAGSPLLEVRPDPTPLELADAKRQVQLSQVDLEQLEKEKVRQKQLHTSRLISDQEWEDMTKRYDEAALRLNIAKEKLALLESGRVMIGDTQIESIIKAPIDGYVLSRSVEVGDPVTPLTSFQEGTVLMRMANMDRLLFKGTVDEIDVGKMAEGMQAEIKVGALPNDTVRGELRKIWLKAEKKDNATVFPIEILLPGSRETLLRAGYSANANIIIRKKEDVLTIPERVVTFRNDSSFVSIPTESGSEEKLIGTGLSDAISIEVTEGLAGGEKVNEKPQKIID